MVLSLAVIVLIVLIGTGLTSWMSGHLRFEERLAIGAVAGALVVSVVALLAFAVIGMDWGSVAIGLVVPGVAALVGVRRQSATLRMELRSTWRRLGRPIGHPSSLRPFALFTVAAGAVTTRVLSLSYQTTSDGISAGSLAVWGDWSAHLAYAGSFAYGDNRAFDLPIAAGHDFRYHFLADFFGSLFTVSGATLPQALVVSEWLLAVAFPPLLWCAVIRLTRSRLTAGLTVVLFTLSGGIGLWYFAADVERNGWSIVSALPRTYARIPEQHIWVDNVISASLYAQRSTLLGLSVGFAAIILILVSRPSGARNGYLAAGLLIGLLGIGHGHTLLTALALAVLALIAERDRIWWWFITPAAVIGLPLAVAILPETSSIRWMVGWMAPDSEQAWPWFWFRNVGLMLPLFAVALAHGRRESPAPPAHRTVLALVHRPEPGGLPPVGVEQHEVLPLLAAGGVPGHRQLDEWTPHTLPAQPNESTHRGPVGGTGHRARHDLGGCARHRAGDAALVGDPLGVHRRSGRRRVATRSQPPRRRDRIWDDEHLGRSGSRRTASDQRIRRLDL